MACAAAQPIDYLVMHAGRGFHVSVHCVNEEQLVSQWAPSEPPRHRILVQNAAS
jgi:hypothetical protein